MPMKSWLICATVSACSGLFATAYAQTETEIRHIEFYELKPYITSLIYIDSASGQVRMCMPQMAKIQKRLASRCLTDVQLAMFIWQAHINLLEGTPTDSVPAAVDMDAWADSWLEAATSAVVDLDCLSETIGETRDYYDLVDYRISQLLGRNPAYLEPLLNELKLMLAMNYDGIACQDCKEHFDAWLHPSAE